MSAAPSMIARVVEAGDAERRRLERDLHDGAQQRLVALGLQLGMLATRLDPDSEASRLLAGAPRRARRVAEGVARHRPRAAPCRPQLRRARRGARGARHARAGPGADRGRGRASARRPPVEVAAYYVVCESLTNVAKYARAATVTVRVAREDGELVVEVADDGIGGADAARARGCAASRPAWRRSAAGCTSRAHRAAGPSSAPSVPCARCSPVDPTVQARERPLLASSWSIRLSAAGF